MGESAGANATNNASANAGASPRPEGLGITRTLHLKKKLPRILGGGYREDPGSSLHALLLDASTAGSDEELRTNLIKGLGKGLKQDNNGDFPAIESGDWIQCQAVSGGSIGGDVAADFGKFVAPEGVTLETKLDLKFTACQAMMVLIGCANESYASTKGKLELKESAYTLAGMSGAVTEFVAKVSFEFSIGAEAKANKALGKDYDKEASEGKFEDSGKVSMELVGAKAEAKAGFKASIEGKWRSWFVYAPVLLSFKNFDQELSRKFAELLGPGNKQEIKHSLEKFYDDLDRSSLVQHERPKGNEVTGRLGEVWGAMKSLTKQSNRPAVQRYYMNLGSLIAKLNADPRMNENDATLSEKLKDLRAKAQWHQARLKRFVTDNLVAKDAAQRSGIVNEKMVSEGKVNNTYQFETTDEQKLRSQAGYQTVLPLIRQTPGFVTVAVSEQQREAGLFGAAGAEAGVKTASGKLKAGASAEVFAGVRYARRHSVSTFQTLKVARDSKETTTRVPIIMTQDVDYIYTTYFRGVEAAGSLEIPRALQAKIGGQKPIVGENVFRYEGKVIYWVAPNDRDYARYLGRQMSVASHKTAEVLSKSSTYNIGRSWSFDFLARASRGGRELDDLALGYGFRMKEGDGREELRNFLAANVGGGRLTDTKTGAGSLTYAYNDKGDTYGDDRNKLDYYLLEIAFDLPEDLNANWEFVPRTHERSTDPARILRLTTNSVKGKPRGRLRGAWLRKRSYDSTCQDRAMFTLGFRYFPAKVNIKLEDVDNAGRHVVANVAAQTWPGKDNNETASPLTILHV